VRAQCVSSRVCAQHVLELVFADTERSVAFTQRASETPTSGDAVVVFDWSLALVLLLNAIAANPLARKVHACVRVLVT
jgi:hypothetical protein